MLKCIDPACTHGCRMCDLPQNRLLQPPEILGVALDELCWKWEITVERLPMVEYEIRVNGTKVVVSRESTLGAACGGKIQMREDLGQNSPEHLATWVHEFAHELLHVPVETDDLERVSRLGNFIPRNDSIRECEAESVAKFVMSGAGIPWSDMTNYHTWDRWDDLGEPEQRVAKIVLFKFRELETRGLVAPPYVWNVVPADPRYARETLTSDKLIGFKRLLPLRVPSVEAYYWTPNV